MINNTTTVDTSEIAKFAELARVWWDKNGPLKTLHDINPIRLKWIQQFIQLSQSNILDIGCGGGILCEGLAHFGAHVTGLDVEPGAIKAANQHAREQNLQINYVCEPVETFNHQTFDAITCLEMLEHVEQPEVVIAAASRLVKPGGYVFLSTINRTMLSYAAMIIAAEYVLSILPRQTHTFERFISPSELAAEVRKNGLTVLNIVGLSYHPITRQAKLNSNQVAINYLLAAQKPGDHYT